ncbi:metallophosphoesterase [Arthrobacter sp. NPDC093128]|uniref:metallophosphoesterase family protein n=1 Tax=Arthrobacter sp. NPDC093128 TaxID=3154979 RepID=UPI00343EF417
MLRIAIVSDIHAGTSDARATHVLAGPSALARGLQPLSDLVHLIGDEGLEADYLVVPGDIANQADAGGLAYGWRKVHEIAENLGAEMIAVPGNHDVVTHSSSADPRAMLKKLLPTFPTGDATIDATFWDKGWAVCESDDHRILMIDSTCAFPPFPTWAVVGDADWHDYMRAIDRGSFPEAMENELDEYIRAADPKLNFVVVHHHPQEHQHKSYLQDEYGAMNRGADLLDLLSRHPRAGRWILIHGHRHIPQLVNAITTTSNGPLVLCAASLGAKLWSPVDTIARNQFHIVDATDEDTSFPGSVRGSVESYTWGYGDGWHASERRGAGLPSTSGFGCSDDFRLVSQQILAHMDDNKLQFIEYAALKGVVPQLPYMLPKDLEFLEGDLEMKGFGFMRDRQNRLRQVIRSTS